MATTTQRIQLRRDTAANWTSNNPLLQAGEVGVEIDTNRQKIGNGSTVWNSLAYVGVATAGWTQSGAGAVARTVDSKLKDVVSVKDFGAVGDGVADDTTEIQAAIDAVSTAGGGALLLPPGTYLTEGLLLKNGVCLVGASEQSTTLKCKQAYSGLYYIYVLSVSNTGLESLTVDVNLSPSGVGGGVVAFRMDAGGGVAANNISLKNVTFKGGLTSPYFDTQVEVASRGVTMQGCTFIGKATLTSAVAPNPQTTLGVRFLPKVAGCGDWMVKDCRFKYLGYSVQIRRGVTSPFAYDWVDSVIISGNISTDFLDDPNISTAPYELSSVTGLVVEGNSIRTGGRGFAAGYVKGGTYSNNVAYDQTSYFLEMACNDGLSIVGNAAYNCKTFVNDTGDSPNPGSVNILISDNVVIGGNEGEPGHAPSYQTLGNTIFTSTTSAYSRWKITNNFIYGPKYTDGVIKLSGTSLSDMEVRGNRIYMTDSTSRPLGIVIPLGSDILVENNYIEYSATITNSTLPGNTLAALLNTGSGASSSNFYIRNNIVRFSGTDARTPPNNVGVIGVGEYTTNVSLPNAQFTGNTLIGAFNTPFFLGINSGDTVFEGNDQSRATGSNFFNAAVVRKRTKRISEATAIPTTGTWATGDIVLNPSPGVSGGVVGWICTVAGTPGSWQPFVTLAQQNSISEFGDVDATLTPGSSRGVAYFGTPLTANRTITLSTTGAWNGARFKIVRTNGATGAFNLNVGGIKTLTAAGQWCDAICQGAFWYLTAYGTL